MHNHQNHQHCQYPPLQKPVKKRVEQVREQADSMQSVLFVLLAVLWSIPTIIALTEFPFDARAGVAFLKFTAACTALARPFTALLQLGAMPGLLLDTAFPGAAEALESRFTEVSSFPVLFEQYIRVPGLLYLLPFIFTVLALVYLGYKLPPQVPALGQALRFSLGKYLGSLAAFVLFWGFAGVFAGMWSVGFVFTQLFVTWGAGWLDLLLWIALSVFLVHVGKFAAGRRVQEPEGAFQLISALQQPVPGRFDSSAQARAQPPAAGVASPVVDTVAAAPVLPVMEHKIQQYCEFCGSKLDARGRFCPGCGVVIEGELAPAPMHASAVEPAPATSERPTVYVDIPAAAAVAAPARPARSPREQKLVTPKELEEMERGLLAIDGFSVQWAVALMGIGLIIGLLSALGGFLEGLFYAILSLPFGIMVVIKDKYTFSDWVFQRNYSSRGVDLVMWGAIGCLCSGAGLMVFVKGVLMVLITQNTPDQFPRLSEQQWRARVFQASMTAAGPLMLFTSIAAMSRFATLHPAGIVWAIITCAAGFIVYYAYSRFLRPEIIRGNLHDLDAPLIIAGVIGLLVSLGGVLILMQGIMIAIQKDEKKKVGDLVAGEVAPGNDSVDAI